MEGSSESNARGLNSSGISEFLPIERIITDRSKSSSRIRNLFGSDKDDNLGRLDDPIVRALEREDVSLRHWLDNPNRSVDGFECFHVFRQIFEIVNVAHSQGIVVHNVRPSCFFMSSFNHVSFIASASCSDSGSDEENPKLTTTTTTKSQEIGGLGSEEATFPYERDISYGDNLVHKS